MIDSVRRHIAANRYTTKEASSDEDSYLAGMVSTVPVVGGMLGGAALAPSGNKSRAALYTSVGSTGGGVAGTALGALIGVALKRSKLRTLALMGGGGLIGSAYGGARGYRAANPTLGDTIFGG